MSPRKKLCQPAVFGLPSAPCVESDQFQSPGTSFVLWRLRGVYLKRKFFFKKKKNQSPTIMFSDLPTREKSAQSVKQRSEPLSCLFVKGFPSSCFLITTWGRGWGEPLKRSPLPARGFPPAPLVTQTLFPCGLIDFSENI